MSVVQRLFMLLLPTHWKLFLSGQEAVADEFEAMLTARSVEAKKHGLDATMEGLDYADRLETAGERDEARAACIAAYKESLVEQARARARILPSASAEEVGELLAAPFSGAPSFGTPSGNGSMAKAIEQSSAEDAAARMEPAVRRGRGRPPGAKNRPKPEQTDAPDSEATEEHSC